MICVSFSQLTALNIIVLTRPLLEKHFPNLVMFWVMMIQVAIQRPTVFYLRNLSLSCVWELCDFNLLALICFALNNVGTWIKELLRGNYVSCACCVWRVWQSLVQTQSVTYGSVLLETQLPVWIRHDQDSLICQVFIIRGRTHKHTVVVIDSDRHIKQGLERQVHYYRYMWEPALNNFSPYGWTLSYHPEAFTC